MGHNQHIWNICVTINQKTLPLNFRFHKIYYYLFIYYLGRGDGSGNNNNNDQENNGGGDGGEGGEVGEVGCERNPIAIGKFLTFHIFFLLIDN